MTLKQWRVSNRYTIPGFLKLLGDKGLVVTQRTVINWENGFCKPSLEKAEKIRDATGGKVNAARLTTASRPRRSSCP
jgi:transcriptional regulator with XRE-family HTH domain